MGPWARSCQQHSHLATRWFRDSDVTLFTPWESDPQLLLEPSENKSVFVCFSFGLESYKNLRSDLPRGVTGCKFCLKWWQHKRKWKQDKKTNEVLKMLREVLTVPGNALPGVQWPKPMYVFLCPRWFELEFSVTGKFQSPDKYNGALMEFSNITIPIVAPIYLQTLKSPCSGWSVSSFCRSQNSQKGSHLEFKPLFFLHKNSFHAIPANLLCAQRQNCLWIVHRAPVPAQPHCSGSPASNQDFWVSSNYNTV